VWLVGFCQRPFQRVGPHPTTEAEIAQLTSIGQEQGAIEEHEGDMIHRVLALNDVTAGDIMTPRPEMLALRANQTLAQAAEQLAQMNRSLIPVYGKNRDEVVGILDRMDALLALAKDKGEMNLTDPVICSKPYYVPTSMTADELLVRFQRRTEHMAIVVGQYGETVGLVTIEDVIEEIVGEIYDEQDIGSGNGIVRVSQDELLCDAAAEIKAVNEAFEIEIPNHRSVAGLLLDEMERNPQEGRGAHLARRFVPHRGRERARDPQGAPHEAACARGGRGRGRGRGGLRPSAEGAARRQPGTTVPGPLAQAGTQPGLRPSRTGRRNRDSARDGRSS
jgi:CBS domain containing-hemolysin-like protein